MLDLGFFRDPRFSAAVVAVMALFFATFGLMFVSTQVLQSVLDHDPLGAGVRLLPLPGMVLLFSQISIRVAARAGTRAVVTAGLVITAGGLAAGATLDADSGYGMLAVALTLTGIGMGSTMAPAVESLMSTVPPARAGVASAVNDSTRLTAAAIGVAVVGSVVSSSYQASLTDVASLLTADQLERARTSLAGALSVAAQLDAPRAGQIVATVRQGFIEGASIGLAIAATVAALGALVAWRFLPAKARRPCVAEDGGGVSASSGEPQLQPIGWVESPLDRDPREGGTVSAQGIGLLYLETHDWEQSVAFWQDLGFKVEVETDHRSGVLVAENGTRVFLAEQSIDDPLGADIYLVVANSADCVPQASAEVVREFTPTHWGTEVMTVRDPDGRLLRLEAPVASESE